MPRGSAMPDAPTLVQGGESETVEFKEQWRDHSALRELAAFANTSGGTLLVGVADDGSIVGWQDDDLDALANKIADSLRLHPSKLQVEAVGHERVLVVNVPEAREPVAYRGRYYHRVGATTREIPPGELARFLTKRSGQTWDALPSGQSVEAVSHEELQRFIRRCADRLPAADPDESIEGLLQKLDLLAEDGSLSQAALLLFGEHPQALAFSAYVRMGRFKDDITIVDEAAIKGSLFDQLDGAMRQFRQYLEIRYEIPEDADGKEGLEIAERREVWTYPLAALREAVVNALIHRDYAALGNIEIRVYDTQLTVSSPGGLPEGMTLEALKQPRHASIQRNPRLAQTFYYAGYVERWGTGTTRIADACRKQGLPAPEFEASADRFTVTFRKDPYTEVRLKEMGLNTRQIRAVRYAKEHGRIDNATLQDMADVTKRTASRDLAALTDRGVLRKVGQTGKGTYYELATAGEGET